MKIRISLVVFATFALVAALGCGKGEDTAVIAKVNRTAITAAEFKRQVQDLAPQMQQAVINDPKARKEFLDDLIGIELVIQEAKQQGLDRDAEFKKRQELLKGELEHRIREDARNELFNTLLKKELGDKLSKISEPAPKDLQEFYEKNKEKIRSAAGKPVSFKEVEPQLKMRLMQEKRRELYVVFAKELRTKAKVALDDKALDSAATSLAASKDADLSGIQAHPASK
jgi:peptidyl-prolyl cis-trans isomerase C